MNDFEALMQLKKYPNRNSPELMSWFDSNFKKIVGKIIFKFGFSQDEAEDLAQEILLKAVEKIDEIRNQAALKGWFNTITRNACIDLIRKKTTTILNDDLVISPSATINKVTVINGIKVTEYSYIEPDHNSKRTLKFNVIYSKADEAGNEQDFDSLLSGFASDFDLFEDSPEKTLIGKNLDDCIQSAISRFELADPHKATALRLLLLDTPKDEIAIELNKSPKAIREYLSQCFKKFKSFAQPCYDNFKLA